MCQKILSIDLKRTRLIEEWIFHSQKQARKTSLWFTITGAGVGIPITLDVIKKFGWGSPRVGAFGSIGIFTRRIPRSTTKHIMNSTSTKSEGGTQD